MSGKALDKEMTYLSAIVETQATLASVVFDPLVPVVQQQDASTTIEVLDTLIQEKIKEIKAA